MITTKQLMAVMAVTALLAVGLVGVGYAYTASTSNTGNTAETVFFTLSQGNEAATYSDSFDVDITYDTVTGIVGGAQTAAEATDAAKLAVEAVADAKNTYDSAVTAFLEAYNEEANPDIESVADATDAEILANEDVATAKATYDNALAAFLAAYNNASIKTLLSFNAVEQDGSDVAMYLFDVDTTITGVNKTVVDALKTTLEEKEAAFLEAYNAVADDDVDDVADATDETTLTTESVATAKTTYDTAKTAYEAYADYDLYYALSGTGKQFTVGKSGDMDEMPQYVFKVSKVGNLDTDNYSYIIGVAFGTDAMTYQVFDGTELEFTSGEPGETSITLGFFLAEKGTAGPSNKPFENLDFTFTVDSEIE